jgi:putative ABC transport system substrate-binding protein
MEFLRRRRQFITLLGGAAAAWPLAARAQQGERMRRVGVLMHLPENDPEAQERMRAFRQGLQQLGWAEGRNVQIDYRFGAADVDRARTSAAELIALAPDVIQASGTGPMAAVQQATRTVPIVFAQVPDPVNAGFVDSLVRPGGNATGFVQFDYGISGKWLELLKTDMPTASSAAAHTLCKTVLVSIMRFPPSFYCRPEFLVRFVHLARQNFSG